jgi:type IV fimbrial biogenesis protein FimT
VLVRHNSQHGVTLIELVIGLAIVGVLFVAATPLFSGWTQNIQIRTAAESVQNGLQQARTEALRRNTSVRFQLTSSVDNSCSLTTTQPNWVINLGAGSNDPTGQCGTTISPMVSATGPNIIQIYNAAINTPHVVAAMSAAANSLIVFNSLGQVVWPTSDTNIDLTNPTGGTCASVAGPMTCMRIIVSVGGQIRMCNPNVASGTPQGC